MVRLPGREKKYDDIFSRVDTIHQRDGRKNRQTDTRQQQTPRLRIALRGKTTDQLRVKVRRNAEVLRSDSCHFELFEFRHLHLVEIRLSHMLPCQMWSF